jgi:hypothetical protein
MFGRVDGALGKKVNEVAEAKIHGKHEHPHKTAWH